MKKQLKDSRSEVEGLCTAKNRLKQAQAEVEILKANNEVSQKKKVYNDLVFEACPSLYFIYYLAVRIIFI